MSPAPQHISSSIAGSPIGTENYPMPSTASSDKDLSNKYFMYIAHVLAGRYNDTEAIGGVNRPILKESIKPVYWLFIIQYAALAFLGMLMNLGIIVYLLYHRLYKDVTHAFIINLALCHFVQCVLVLPISLMVMLLENWIFGQFMCFFLPMLQDIPLHVAMLSHILIAWDRMRWLSDPMKGRLPGFVCCCATWLTGMVIALPYPIYTIYVELGDFVPQLNGMGLCLVNLMDDMHEYMRGLFFIMYCAPAILLSYLYIRTSQELRPPEGPFAVMMYEHRADMRMRQRNSTTSSVEPSHSGGGVAGLSTTTSHSNGGHAASGAAISAASNSGNYDLYSAELDVHREKRKQRNFGSMAATQVVCVCPLMVLRFARLSLEETYENAKHFDFTYLMFVWVAFLPTVIFPCIYASQILPRNEQERLRGYFRLSANKKSSRSNAANGGNCNGAASSTRDNSIEKDEHTNTTTIMTNGAQGNDNDIYSAPHKPSKTHRAGGHEQRAERHSSVSFNNERYSGSNYRHNKERHRNNPLAGRGAADAGVVNNLGKDIRNKKHDVKINIISNGQGSASSAHASQRNPKLTSSSNNSSPNAAVTRKSGHARHGGGSERRLTVASLDNNSVSNITASTYCNGNGSTLLDDSSTSNYGDGEESSVVSSMMVPNSAHLAARWHATGDGMRHKDVSFSECSSTFSRMGSCSSTLERDLEIIELLERERSMDIQDMMEREKHGEKVRLSGGMGRQLPDIEKLYAQRSPKSKRDPYSYDKAMLLAKQGISSTVLAGSDPLSMSHSTHSSQPTETYSLSSTLLEEELSTAHEDRLLPHLGVHDKQQAMEAAAAQEEEVPQDFFDNYTPGGSTNMPPGSIMPAVQNVVAPAPAYQYQYTRRLSRKGSHHNTSLGSLHHRGSKRDSFNSLNGSDLIAGAFCELDPTQPLNKMSVIDSRMRRSSPRNSSFSSTSARSSMKSRDYGHSSTHSAHPELDFRENIFAEL